MTRPYYLDFTSKPLLDEIARDATDVPAVPGLKVAAGLRDEFADILTDDALAFLVELAGKTRDSLDALHHQRKVDRAFIDERTKAHVEHNADIEFTSPDYRSVIGEKDENGRMLVGPLPESEPRLVAVPAFLVGYHVTLFGPPDSAKLSINAMNAIHRVPAAEPPIVSELVDQCDQVARWGADNEDSKTPIMRNLLAATRNLKGCLDRTLTFHDERRGKDYALANDRLSIPIKRFPGLAIPDINHLLDGEPLPLHLVDFGLHLFHNRHNAEALVFYVPKLENEEEATYLKDLIATAEGMIKAIEPAYKLGTVKLFVVFENPRAIFRIREMANALHPHFVGGSLGWHDFLGSTARLFRHDPRYRIPVKADPNIVINHIRESHRILVDAVHPAGGIAIGGMYGVLFEDGNPKSYEVSMVGFIKDVVTQMKRGLDGFWVAHPDFVRIGIAIVHAWRLREAGDKDTFNTLVEALVPSETERSPLMEFVNGEDVPGLKKSDPLYPRAVLAATLEESDVIPNNHPDEVQYNVFQALQYIADWLRGNGCVALPAAMTNASGESVFVRIMDDLATTERSRWELWAEINHGRFAVDRFTSMVDDELAFIKAGQDAPDHRIQVHWTEETAKWYPIAAKLLKQLVLEKEPPEFATELLLPFTTDVIRDSDDPWATACALCPEKYHG